MRLRLFLLALFSALAACSCKNVLFIAGLGNKSHWGSMMNVINSLIDGGHNVTLFRVTLEESWPPMCARCHHYDLSVAKIQRPPSRLFELEMRGWHAGLVERMMQNASASLWSGRHRVVVGAAPHDRFRSRRCCTTSTGTCSWSTKSSARSASASPSTCTFGVPFALISPSILFFANAEALSLGVTAAAQMTAFPPIPREPYKKYDGAAFWPRLSNAAEHMLEYLSIRHFEPLLPGPRFHQLITGQPLNWNRLYQKARGIFAEDIPKMAYHNPTLQNIVRTSYNCPRLPSPSEARLPEDMRHFIEDPTSKGTIIVAFGTFADFQNAPDALRLNFFEALAAFPEYRIVMQNAGAASLPSNFLPNASFLPQKELLVHASARLFISHGGLKSLKEAVCAGTPVLVMPVAAEQALNARIAREWQLAEVIHKVHFSRDELVRKIRKMLSEDDSYRRNGSRFARILQDNPVEMSTLALHTANKFMSPFWADKLVKHRGLFMGFREIYYYELIAGVLFAVGFVSL